MVLTSYAETTPVADPKPAERSWENGKERSVAEVLEETLKNHPLLRVRQHEVEAARAELIEARLLPNPQLVSDVDSQTEGDNETTLSSRLTIDLPIGPKRRLRTAAAECGVRESERALDAEALAVLVEASDAAIEVLYWQEMTVLQRRLRTLAEQTAEVQKERFKIGATDFRRMVLADLTLADADLAERNAIASLQVAQVRLAAAMGRRDGELLAIRGELTAAPIPSISLERVLAHARCVAPELAQYQAAVAKDFQRVTLERWNAIPDVNVGPRFRHDFSGNPDEAGARVGFDIPIFNRNQGGVAAGSAQLAGDLARLELAEITTYSQVGATFLELQSVEENYRHYSEQVQPMMEKTETALEQASREGDLPLNDVIALMQQFGKMRKNNLDLCSRHYRLRNRLEILLQRRLADL